MSAVSFRIAFSAFDPEAELGAFRRDAPVGTGAVVVMTGMARAENQDGEQVAGLILHHYAGFTETHVEKVMQDAVLRWETLAVRVVHRVGEVVPPEAIVFVAVAARHRREAFAAADFLMDDLKTSAPFWKQEKRPSGTFWITPRSDDYESAARWKAVGS